MTEHEQFWAGDFGREYLKRNRVEWPKRRAFWELILEKTGARSVLEVGCNAGWNLLALRDVGRNLKLRGVDVNVQALGEATAAFLDAREIPAREVGALWPKSFDLVFTAGVLIHVPPPDLPETLVSIVNASKRWVLAVEYESAKEEEVAYRGHGDRLWRRPYGLQYEAMGLEVEDSGKLAPGDGFDSCVYWLMRKPEAQ